MKNNLVMLPGYNSEIKSVVVNLDHVVSVEISVNGDSTISVMKCKSAELTKEQTSVLMDAMGFKNELS